LQKAKLKIGMQPFIKKIGQIYTLIKIKK